MLLSVVIPSWNGKTLLEECLPSILKSITVAPSAEVIVVDNGSTDGTGEWIETAFPSVRFIGLKRNTGFTGAVNAGAQQATGELLLILNNDCRIDAQSLKTLIATLAKNAEIVATQPVVMTESGRVEHVGFVVQVDRAKATVITSPDAKYIEVRYQQWNNQTRLFYGLSGTCLLIRTSVFKDVGMFDEGFHSYLEDVDLAIRLAKKGYRYSPTRGSKCVHKHRGTSAHMGNYKERRDFSNWIKIILKHYSPGLFGRYWWSLTIERLRNLNGVLKKLVQ